MQTCSADGGLPVQLQMMAVVLPSCYVSPQQAARLLLVFNPKVSEQEVNRAGIMLGAAVTDPLDYWLDVLPLLQPSARADMLTTAALAGRLDLGNPTGRCGPQPPAQLMLEGELVLCQWLLRFRCRCARRGCCGPTN